MSINWIELNDKKPVEGQRCLTKMKHGIIEGTWNEKDEVFEGYYWRDMEWWASAWAPIEEIA